MSSRREKNRRIRMLKSKLAYYKSTLSEMKEILSEYDSEWSRDSQAAIEKFSGLSKKPSEDKKSNSVEINGSSNQSAPGQSDDLEDKEVKDKLSSINAPPWAKELFRKIARRTHPDVNNDPGMVDYFRSATASMDSGKYEALIDIALDLGMDPGIDQSEMIKRLDSRVSTLKKKVEKIEKSIGWAWGESFGFDDIRVKILGAFLRSRGIDYKKEDLERFSGSLSDS